MLVSITHRDVQLTVRRRWENRLLIGGPKVTKQRAGLESLLWRRAGKERLEEGDNYVRIDDHGVWDRDNGE